MRTVAWLLLSAVLALSGAGLVAQLSHPPGDARRAELTYTADLALATQLDGLASELSGVSTQVDGLAADARAALTAVAAADGDALKAALDRGASQATLAETTVAQIRSRLAGLPGEGHEATAVYSNATLVRRAALLAALDSVGGLSPLWDSVTTQANAAAALILAIRTHDTTVAAAATLGVQANYAAAIEQMTAAAAVTQQVVQLRLEVVSGTDSTVLDDWIKVHQAYDTTLTNLYAALKKSHGVRNPVVDAAYRAEQQARANLPADNRQIIVIVAEVAQGGLNQAVIAIDDARGRIDQALGAAGAS